MINVVGRSGFLAGLTLVLLTGCGAATQSTLSAPPPSAQVSPSAEVSPSTEAARPTTDALPFGWTQLRPGDPAVTFAVPPGWQQLAVASYRQQAVKLTQSAVAGIAQMGKSALADIDEHRLRYAAFGPASAPGVTIVVELYVDGRDSTVEAAADRIVAEMTAALEKLASRTTVDTPLGPGVRLRFEADPGGTFIPSQTVQYVIQRPDGSILRINSTSVATDTGFEPFIDKVVATLAST
jgi:hypothetical protein